MSGKLTGFNRFIYLTQIILLKNYLWQTRPDIRTRDQTNFARKNPLPSCQSVLNSRNLHLLKENIFSQTEKHFFPLKKVFLLRKSPHQMEFTHTCDTNVNPHVSIYLILDATALAIQYIKVSIDKATSVLSLSSGDGKTISQGETCSPPVQCTVQLHFIFSQQITK